MVSRARPRVVDRTPDQLGSDRVALDIPDHGQEVSVRLDGKGMEALLEEVAPYPFAEVHVASVAPVSFPDRPGQGVGPTRDHDQVDVVGHQTPGPKPQPVASAKLRQQAQVLFSIRLGGEDREGADATLDDMMGTLRDHHAGQACHAPILESVLHVVKDNSCILSPEFLSQNSRILSPEFR
jgi:hypothetical protein